MVDRTDGAETSINKSLYIEEREDQEVQTAEALNEADGFPEEEEGAGETGGDSLVGAKTIINKILQYTNYGSVSMGEARPIMSKREEDLIDSKLMGDFSSQATDPLIDKLMADGGKDGGD